MPFLEGELKAISQMYFQSSVVKSTNNFSNNIYKRNNFSEHTGDYFKLTWVNEPLTLL